MTDTAHISDAACRAIARDTIERGLGGLSAGSLGALIERFLFRDAGSGRDLAESILEARRGLVGRAISARAMLLRESMPRSANVGDALTELERLIHGTS